MNNDKNFIKKEDINNSFNRGGLSLSQKDLHKKIIDESKEIVLDFKTVCKTKLYELKKRAEKEGLKITDEDEKELFELFLEAKEVRLDMLEEVLSEEEKVEEVVVKAKDILHSRFDKKQNKVTKKKFTVDDLLTGVESGDFILEEEIPVAGVVVENNEKTEVVVEEVEIKAEKHDEEVKKIEEKTEKKVKKTRMKDSFIKYLNKVSNKVDSFLDKLVS
ncbi:hypothetical protein K9M47_04790 [Candidatus Gracilibacteria bacterium]|nr:hypothetical protein [Candidatus Gracilibacteria bacterium]MCF7898775.1 hypothetical protein [Candidatus Paceibacterota bacterium]